MARELLVSRKAGRYWAAVRESGRTVELRAEIVDVGCVVGRIYSARVSQVVPGIQSAFLDIGGERSAFIRNEDLFLPGDPPRRKRLSAKDSGAAVPPIEDRLKAGRDLLVQIVRESRDRKETGRQAGFRSQAGFWC